MRVDHDRVRADLAIGRQHPSRELVALVLEAVALAALTPRPRILEPHVEQDHEVGREPAQRERVDRAHGLDAEPAHGALVDERAVDEAIGHDDLAASQRRLDDLGYPLGSRGREDERLCARVERQVGIEHDPAQLLARTRAARLAQLANRVAVGAQALGEQPRLRRLAGSVAAFEDDETRDLRVLTASGDGPDDSEMKWLGSEAGVGCGAGGRGSAAKSASRMASAPSYIVYGHRRGVRIALRLFVLGVLLSALTAVLVGASKITGSAKQVLTVAEQKSPTKKPPAANPKAPHHVRATSHKPAVPLPPTSKIPVTILNANGVNGAARSLSAKLSSLGYPVKYVGDAQGRGTPTMVQFHVPYGPAARRLARQVGNVRYISLPDGLTPGDFRGAKIVVILGT